MGNPTAQRAETLVTFGTSEQQTPELIPAYPFLLCLHPSAHREDFTHLLQTLPG